MKYSFFILLYKILTQFFSFFPLELFENGHDFSSKPRLFRDEKRHHKPRCARADVLAGARIAVLEARGAAAEHAIQGIIREGSALFPVYTGAPPPFSGSRQGVLSVKC